MTVLLDVDIPLITRRADGDTHLVEPAAGSAVVVLGDFMRADRLIDLDDGQFVRVCGELSRGLCRVTVAP